MKFMKTEKGEQVSISSEKIAINPEGSAFTWKWLETSKADAVMIVKALVDEHGLNEEDFKK